MTKRKRNSRFCSFFAVLPFIVHTLLGQTPDFQGTRGISPTGLYYVNNLDSIDPVSGNMMLRIPITAHAPIRAGFTSDLSLVYNSNIIDRDPDGDGHYYLTETGSGWAYAYQYTLIQDTPLTSGCPDANYPGVPIYRFVLLFPDGSHHPLHLYSDLSDIGDGLSLTDGMQGIVIGSPCNTYTQSNNPLTYHTSDGTFVKVVVTPGTSTQTFGWSAYFPDGRIVQFSAGSTTITDRNGNAIFMHNLVYYNTVNTVLADGIDPSRDVQITYHASAQPPYTFQDTIAQNGAGSPNNQPGSASLLWTVNWRDIPATTLTYLCPRALGGPFCPMDTQQSQIDSIILPSFDGSTQRIQFGYDTDSSPSGGYGQLNLVIPPTAPAACNRNNYLTMSCPYFSYSYQGGSANLNSSSLFDQQSRVTQKQQVWVEDQTSNLRTDTWQYQYQGTPAASPTTIHNPDGGIEVINWSYHSNSQCGAIGPPLVDKIVHPDQSTEEKVWQQNAPFYSGRCDPGNFFLKTNYESVSDGSAPQAVSAADYTYDKNGNITQLDEYDFAPYPTPPATLSFGTKARSTVNTYMVGTNIFSDTTDSTAAYWNPATNPSPTTAPILLQLLRRKEVDDSKGLGPGSVVEFSYDSRGNVLNQFNWDSAKAASMPALGALNSSNSAWRHFLYDGYGNLSDETDPLCTTTRYSYDSNTLNLTGFTEDYRGDAVGCTPPGATLTRSTTVQTELWSGLEKSRTDYNGVTRATAYDPLGRTTSITESVGSQIVRVSSKFYSDGNRRVTTCTDLNSPGDLALVSVTAYDQLGRVNQTGSLESGNPNASRCLDIAPSGILTDTRYVSGSGVSYKLVSNPYRSTADSTMGWTLTTVDTKGRVTLVTSYDGSTPPAPWGGNSTKTGEIATSYSATSSSEVRTVFDQVATRTLNLDGLGRTSSVVEAGTAATSYTYDALNNLTTVTQNGIGTLPGQPGVGQACSSGVSRCFAFDSLSRLRWATNPESGTISYLYDGKGNPTSKTDARGVTTTSVYDQLSRLVNKTYNDGSTPSVTYHYGTQTTLCPSPPSGTSYAIGRLISVSNSVSSYNYDCYDALGRVLHGAQTTGSAPPYQFTYAYSAAGSVTSMTYPSGRQVSYSYDNHGRTTTVRNVAANANYWGNILYAPNGAITSAAMGNNVVESTSYNHRFQPTQIQAGSLLTLSYFYCPNQQASCTTNNGNVQSQTVTRGNQTWNATYSYNDGMNRLTGASETGPGTAWTEAYGYDSAGNRWISNAPEPGLPPPTSEVPQTSSWYTASNLANNRILDRVGGWQYDKSGNVLSVAGMQRTFVFDAEDRQTSAVINGTATTYTYDGDDHRITKAVGGAAPTIYVYDTFGQLAAEYGTPSSQSGTSYLTADMLGSTRLKTDSSGAVTNCYDYLPFGQDLLAGTDGRPSTCFATAPDGFNLKFTGKERDAETGLDFFGVRYFSGAQGRFTSPDPVYFQKEMLSDPQRFNLYGYVRNNPLRYVDPKGEAMELTGTDEERAKKLAALQSKIGEAGKYLYDNLYKGKHYVGIYKNGQDGKGPAFESINDATKALSQIIKNNTVSTIEFAQEGSQIQSGNGRVLATIGSIDVATGKGPGSTRMQPDGSITTYVLAPGLSTGRLPGPMMSNGVPGQTDTGFVIWHEMGHVLGLMSGEVGPQSNDRADNLENTVRRLKDPTAPVRMMHDPPPGVR